MGKLIPFRRRRLPSLWRPYVRRGNWPSAPLRQMVWAGMLLGLLAYQVTANVSEASIVGGSVRVIDGDTFDYGGLRVRVADMDTPEVHGRCAYETELAARATQRMRTLLAAGPFELRPLASGRDEDRYGRKLRIVTRGGRSLGDQLVAEGLARTWTGRREPWCIWQPFGERRRSRQGTSFV